MSDSEGAASAGGSSDGSVAALGWRSPSLPSDVESHVALGWRSPASLSDSTLRDCPTPSDVDDGDVDVHDALDAAPIAGDPGSDPPGPDDAPPRRISAAKSL
eukprot:5121743-Pyramimonas_sp.AAC.1